MSKIGITTLGDGRFEVDLSEAQGKTLRDLLEEKGIDVNGQSVVVNGRRIANSTLASTPAEEAEEVEVLTKSKGGC